MRRTAVAREAISTPTPYRFAYLRSRNRCAPAFVISRGGLGIMGAILYCCQVSGYRDSDFGHSLFFLQPQRESLPSSWYSPISYLLATHLRGSLARLPSHLWYGAIPCFERAP
jgi:hypothetical protein